MRINKYLSASGICSRRGADRLLEEGRVTVDGRIAGVGEQVSEENRVEVDGKPVRLKAEKTYLAFYKPRGIVCTFERREKKNLNSCLALPGGVTYAGRLDRESEGLLILTDDGDLIHEMMTGRNGHEKEYIVTVDRDLTEPFLNSLREGVCLSELNVVTRPCRADRIDRRTFRIVLTQGLNRQIRRMCGAGGYGVTRLIRVRVVNILLGEMRPGEVRSLSGRELTELRKSLSSEGAHFL